MGCDLAGNTVRTTSEIQNLSPGFLRQMSTPVNHLQASLNISHVGLRLSMRNLTHLLPPNHYKSSISSLEHTFYKTHWFSPIKKASHHSDLTRYVRPVFTERNSLRCKNRYTVSGCIPRYSADSFAVNHLLIQSITPFLKKEVESRVRPLHFSVHAGAFTHENFRKINGDAGAAERSSGKC